jgi:hypothetical protein
MTRLSTRPFYPCQTVTGETFVIDDRSNTIARQISSSFDTTERWREAKRIADKLNRDHIRRTYAKRQRAAFGCLILVVVLFVIEVASGDLSEAVRSVINAAL